MVKRLLKIFLITVILTGPVTGLVKGYAYYSQMPEYLCELGLEFYNQGRLEEALHEFKKALLAQSNYEPALKYIQMIEQEKRTNVQISEVTPSYYKSKQYVSSQDAVNEYLDLIEIQREMIQQGRQYQPVSSRITGTVLPSAPSAEALPAKAAVSAEEKTLPPPVLLLDESLSKIQKPVEIEQAKSLILRGKNIQRYLLTSTNIIIPQKLGSDELLLTGKNIGYTYLHVWDDNGRWTLELLCVLPKPKGPTLDEEMRLEEERASAFKLRYDLSWHNFSQGRRLENLTRQYYSYDHNISLTGTTPYGNIDSLAIARTLHPRGVDKSTDLQYFTLGLTEGKLGNFRDFTLRGFDFYPAIDNFAFGGGTTLRGAMIESPAFNKKIKYIGFWGREGGGKFGPLSPGLQKIKRSYMEGGSINFTPNKTFSYNVSAFHGYGPEREQNLPSYAYDADVNLKLANSVHTYEVGYNGEDFAHLLNGNFIRPRAKFTYEYRDVSKKFINIAGNVWRRGERGGLFTLNLDPNDNWNIFNRFDVYQDRGFPAEENKNRLNEEYDLYSRYTIDPSTLFRTSYSFQNDLGKIAQTRYLSAGAGINKSFNLIRTVNSNLDYRYRQLQDFSNPSNSYSNENVSGGIRFNLTGQLYFFANKEFNWLTETFTGNLTKPSIFETGLDFSSQIPKTQFFNNLRFIYHDEENTASPLSFLSGEDYIEGYAELDYRPNLATESYVSTRVRNVWADNPSVVKRIEAEINAGIRYVWDTGVHWESMGNIEGYVFRDLNSDGLRQRDEPPVEGIKILLGKNKSATTDTFGYYRFKGVRGKNAFVLLDAQSLPSGFVLTSPQRQEVGILQGRTTRADFGIISRSEISGIVFFDANDNGQYDPQEKGIKGVKLILEDGKEILTDSDGRYSFRNVLTGEHKIMLDLRTLPQEYLPKVPLTKEFTLFEGVSYAYNIPLKKLSK